MKRRHSRRKEDTLERVTVQRPNYVIYWRFMSFKSGFDANINGGDPAAWCVWWLLLSGWPVVGFDYGSYKWTVKKNHSLCVSGMLEDSNFGLYISDAFHKAFLEVSQILSTSLRVCFTLYKSFFPSVGWDHWLYSNDQRSFQVWEAKPMQKYKKKLFSYELAGFLGYFSPEMVKKKKTWQTGGWWLHTFLQTHYDQD